MIQVLIVEDDPMVAELSRRFIQKYEGFTVAAVVGNATEAMKLLNSNPIDLVLADIFMPGPSGLNMLAEIRSLAIDVDVIMVTAARDSSILNQALRLGALDYLIKPFEFDRLSRALDKYRSRRESIGDSKQFSQEELDAKILQQPEIGLLPKGLDRQTLQVVLVAAGKCESPFTTEELSKQLGISRVTLRKYLDHLTAQGSLNTRLTYGAVGRPVNIYFRT